MPADGLVQVEGTGARWLIHHAAARAEALIEELLQRAVALWRKEQYSSFNAYENSLSVRLYGFCKDVLRQDEDQFAPVNVVWEANEPSAGMLRGLDSPDQSPRPDFTILIGRRDLKIEAKRIDGMTRLYREYVVNGMRRYWDRRYSPSAGVAFMFAYVRGVDPDDVLSGINQQIQSVRRFSAAQVATNRRCDLELLSARRVLAEDFCLAISRHSDLVLWHYVLVIA